MRNHLLKIYVVGLILLNVLSACSIPGVSSNQEKVYDKLHKDELNLFAEKIKQRTLEFPNDVFNNQFSNDYFTERIYANGVAKSLVDFEMKNSISHTISMLVYNLGQQVTNSNYDFVKVLEDSNEILFRMYTEGLNYHRFLVIKEDGIPKIGDVYVYSSGEYLSETMANIFIASIQKSNPILKEFSRDKVDGLALIGQARNTIATNPKFAKVLLDSAAALYQKDKSWHLINISCASMLDSASYVSSMRDFKIQYSNDPSWYLMGLDYYFYLEEWDSTQYLINLLEKEIGNDYVLDYLRSNSYFAEGKIKDAYSLINKCLKKNPGFENGYYDKLIIESEMNDYKKARATIDSLSIKFDVEESEIPFLELYAEF